MLSGSSQTNKIGVFAKTIHLKIVDYFRKNSIFDIWLVSEYTFHTASVNSQNKDISLMQVTGLMNC